MGGGRVIGREANRIIAEKPEGWRCRLFEQVLLDELEARRDLRRRYCWHLC